MAVGEDIPPSSLNVLRTSGHGKAIIPAFRRFLAQASETAERRLSDKTSVAAGLGSHALTASDLDLP